MVLPGLAGDTEDSFPIIIFCFWMTATFFPGRRFNVANLKLATRFPPLDHVYRASSSPKVCFHMKDLFAFCLFFEDRPRRLMDSGQVKCICGLVLVGYRLGSSLLFSSCRTTAFKPTLQRSRAISFCRPGLMRVHLRVSLFGMTLAANSGLRCPRTCMASRDLFSLLAPFFFNLRRTWHVRHPASSQADENSYIYCHISEANPMVSCPRRHQPNSN
ncbi:hypothetical protein BDN72DRAFT_262228 [Pluteus cervinus]|uniref:Uncharacterized protein n=1 Tax=Pluteus cervinus TaxID=181527 RepID=A0ACD3AFP2_9AGAR|nr:hypothetical protein BDN72DRAFT_262228 [Pluteus cervinus]